MIATILICIVILLLLIILDFKLGRKSHKNNARTLPFTETTGDYRLYKNGAPFFEDLFQEISEAQVQVDIFFYLISSDQAGRDFLQVLKNKAREGVPVRLLTDRLGGYQMSKSIRNDLKSAGVQFYFSAVPGFPYFFYKLNRRNHRKTTVIDGKIAYAGGFNIGRNYLGENPKFGDWRDYHLRLTGPVVTELHDVFLDDWYGASGEKHNPIINHDEGKHSLKIVPTDGMKLEGEFLKVIESAKREILIGTPYFIPTKKLMDAFKHALERGVTLQIMVPLKADHPFVKEAAIPYLEQLYRLGTQICLYDAGFYHSKVMIIDQSIADIGTANFDQRSFFLNKEVNTFVYDEAFISDLRQSYMDDARNAIPFDEEWLAQRSLATKINVQIAKLLRPIL
ncbi:cardiolipin synthase [Halobacillus shinanisalinarum]|uniref:Cardiolipin synthase n=1 Tax=Halobacillus shinanisalinarum TaxID=2932258 RepID=A0ABY4H3Q6_9BACI|nr:cardiolipin synthase [Halobacillus shinanisalinarum]UOQ94989.1 cardiolipin synthase [Halobacillus shinanisalinarum]